MTHFSIQCLAGLSWEAETPSNSYCEVKRQCGLSYSATQQCNSASIANGTRHVFQAVKLLQNLTPTEVKIARKVVQRNAYFAHPEWVLITMLPDTNHNVRSEAVKLIQRIRKHCESRMRSDQLESDSDGAKGGTGGDNGSEDDLSDQNVEEDGVPIDIEIRYYKVPTLNKLTGMPIAILQLST